MFTPLDPTNTQSFMERFYRCYDGVIQSISIDMAAGAKKYSIVVAIQVKDATIEDENYWVNLTLHFKNVSEFHIDVANKGYIQVISFGVSVLYNDGKLFFDFVNDESEDIAEIRESDFYVVAQSCEWAVQALNESN